MAVNWVSNTSVTILPVVWWERYEINCQIALGSSKVVHPPEKRAPQYFHPGLLLRCGIQRRCSSTQTWCCVPEEEVIFDCKINISDISGFWYSKVATCIWTMLATHLTTMSLTVPHLLFFIMCSNGLVEKMFNNSVKLKKHMFTSHLRKSFWKWKFESSPFWMNFWANCLRKG